MDRQKAKANFAKTQLQSSKIQWLPKIKVILPFAQRNELLVRAFNNYSAKQEDQKRFLGGFLWPVKGRISGVFGSQRILNGVLVTTMDWI